MYQHTSFDDYLRQGKSNNYIDAEQKGLYKAGEAARFLTRQLKMKVLAADVIPFCREWHHAGVFKGHRGRLRGRVVHFIDAGRLNNITAADIEAGRQQARQQTEQDQQPICGWYVDFEQLKTKHGKTYYVPRVGLFEGPQGQAVYKRDFQALSREEFEKARPFAGRRLNPYAVRYDDVKL